MRILETRLETFCYTRNRTTQTLQRALQTAHLGRGGGEIDVHGFRTGQTCDEGQNRVGKSRGPEIKISAIQNNFFSRRGPAAIGEEGHEHSVRSYTFRCNKKIWTEKESGTKQYNIFSFWLLSHIQPNANIDPLQQDDSEATAR